MKRLITKREIETCCICGKEFDKRKMKGLDIGSKTKWMCQECYSGGNRQLDARRSEWRSSSKGKKIIKETEKYK